jgi:twitching motility protein PilI
MGVVNLRGNMVPVFDIALLLGFDTVPANGRHKLLFVHMRDEWVGMACKELPVRVRLEPQSRLAKIPALPPLLQQHVRDCYNDRQVWVYWDIDRFFMTAMGNG